MLVYFPDKGASDHLDAIPHRALGPARLLHLAPSEKRWKNASLCVKIVHFKDGFLYLVLACSFKWWIFPVYFSVILINFLVNFSPSDINPPALSSPYSLLQSCHQTESDSLIFANKSFAWKYQFEFEWTLLNCSNGTQSLCRNVKIHAMQGKSSNPFIWLHHSLHLDYVHLCILQYLDIYLLVRIRIKFLLAIHNPALDWKMNP